MAYRILSIERIDGSSLPEPLPDGYARWKALVEFWDGPANGQAPIVDEVVLDRVTQTQRPAGGDNWTLKTTDQTLRDFLAELLDGIEPVYEAEIRKGRRGFMGDPNPDQHGREKPNDAIARHANVRGLINQVRGRQ